MDQSKKYTYLTIQKNSDIQIKENLFQTFDG